jgi:hypothetical protein
VRAHIESIRARLPNFSPQRRTRRKDPAASVLDPVSAALGINDMAGAALHAGTRGVNPTIDMPTEVDRHKTAA